MIIINLFESPRPLGRPPAGAPAPARDGLEGPRSQAA